MELNLRQRIGQCRPRTNRERLERLNSLRPVILVFAVLFAAVTLLGSTLAWYTAADNELNKMFRRSSEKDFSIILVDDFEPPEPPGPGESFFKTVGAQNTGKIPGFVRLLVLPAVIAADGETVLPATLGEGPGDTVVIVDMGDKWVYCPGDGYYYYLDRIDPGQSAQDLFTELELGNPLGSEYENAGLKIEVKCEAAGLDNYRSSWWNLADNANAGAPWAAIDTALQSARS